MYWKLHFRESTRYFWMLTKYFLFQQYIIHFARDYQQNILSRRPKFRHGPDSWLDLTKYRSFSRKIRFSVRETVSHRFKLMKNNSCFLLVCSSVFSDKGIFMKWINFFVNLGTRNVGTNWKKIYGESTNWCLYERMALWITFGCCGLIWALKYSVIFPWDSWWWWLWWILPEADWVDCFMPAAASPRAVGSAAPAFGNVPASGSTLSLLYVEQAVAARGGVQGHWGLVPLCEGGVVGASLSEVGKGLGAVPRIATPSSLLVLQGEPGSVMSLVPLLLQSPQDIATPL